MTLLKRLQRELTCTSTPWVPIGAASIRRFVNEIVLGEESDLIDGVPTSHYEMYLDAMRALGADTTEVEGYVRLLQQGLDPLIAAPEVRVHPAIQTFLGHSHELATSPSIVTVASAFAFGRESLIPEMFVTLRKAGRKHPPMAKLVDYFDRHIAMDGDDHGPLAFALVDELCGDDDRNWVDAEHAARAALRGRLQLWDAIAVDIRTSATRRAGA